MILPVNGHAAIEWIRRRSRKMQSRKEMKCCARKVFRKHYGIFVVICLIAAFIGAEFTQTLSYTKYQRAENEVSENTAGGTNDQPAADAVWSSSIFQTERGVFADIVNAVTSGSLLATIVSAMDSIFGSQNITIMILILLSLFLNLAIWMFIKNIYVVVSRRMFLEGRCYDRLPVQRFLFIVKVKKWMKVSWCMLVRTVFLFLWWLTIAGGVIKTFSYYLVPYIAAENPDISAKEALTLSRKMMNGHKWECFIFECSYLGWELLSLLTFGLVGIFYAHPYKAAAFSEYYAQLRTQAKEAALPGSELLNDRYLYEKADEAALRQVYADVIAVIEEPAPSRQKGIPGFLAEIFGVTLRYTEKDQAYEERQIRLIRIRKRKDAAAGRVYPSSLSPLPEKQKHSRAEVLNYMRRYSVCSLILIFFVFCLIGWLWEVSLRLIEGGYFANRGVLHGPWLPIYGSGGVLILVLLNKFRSRPALEFASTVVLCGIVEYFTAFYLETVYDGMKWWDYSGYFINLHGRICAEGLLVFGIGGMAAVYIIAPMLDNLLKRLPRKARIAACAALLILFAADVVYSGKHPNAGAGISSGTSFICIVSKRIYTALF